MEYRIAIRTSTCACRCVPVNCCQPGATQEGIIADARHTIANRHARKPSAIFKGTIAYARHTVGDCYARKPSAIFKGTFV